MKIVYTESSLRWGNQEARVLSEAQGLMARGHEVRLICPPGALIHVEARNRGVPVVGLPIARKRPLGVKVLYTWLKANRSDVVSTNSSTDAWLSALALLALGRPVAMVRTCHISAPVPRNVATRWLYTRACARIVTTEETLKEDLMRRNGIPPGKIDAVPGGLDPGMLVRMEAIYRQVSGAR